MRVLITGATGFIGQHLVRSLLEQGIDNVLLVRELYGLGQPLPPHLQAVRPQLNLVYADLRNYTLARRAVAEAQPDVAIHLAAVGVTDPYLSVEQALRHNLTGTLNLARAIFADDASSRRLIVARTPGEAAPANAYQASKAAAWNFCQMYVNQMGWQINGATIFQAYGPRQPARTFIRAAFAAASNATDFAMSSGEQERDWIYVDDVVAGLLAVAQSDLPPGKSVDLGAGKTHSLLEVAQRIYELVGRGGQPLPGRLPNRSGEALRQQADASKTEATTGWAARTSLNVGLQKLWNALEQAANDQ